MKLALAAASLMFCASASYAQAQPRAADATSKRAPLTVSSASDPAREQPRAAAAAAKRAPLTASQAAGRDAIQLDILDCAQVSGARVREIVALEMAPRQVLAVGGTGPAATHVILSCPAGVAQISVEEATRATPLQLEIALRDLDPPARSRLVALAIAELITTSRLQRPLRTDGSHAASGPAASSDRAANLSAANTTESAAARDARSAAASGGRAAGSDDDTSVSGAALAARDDELSGAGVAAASGSDVGASGDALAVSTADVDGAAERDLGADSYDAAADGGEVMAAQLWLGLGAARIAEPIMFAPAAAGGVSVYWGAFALHADVRFEHAQMTRSVAELQLDSGSLALVPAWRVHGRIADVSIGPGLRAGYASLQARPNEPAFLGQTLNGFWLAPCAQLAVQLRFAERWAVRLGAELAYITRTLRGLDANGDSLLALRDLALAAQLGVSWDAVAVR